MNYKLYPINLVLISTLFLLITSCNNNVSNPTTSCPEGYEGSNCSVEWATKFINSYMCIDTVFESTSGNGGIYNLTKPAVITKKTVSVINITNFGGFDSFVEATISKAQSTDTTATKLSINFTDPEGRQFSGTGSIKDNFISGKYRVTFSRYNTYDSTSFKYTKIN